MRRATWSGCGRSPATMACPSPCTSTATASFQRRRRELWTIEEELAGGPLPTQFGRVLQELGIRPIYALSPQAKGRVERLWGTLQDRLVAELRLAGVHTLAEANQLLPIFVGQFNARFAVPPAEDRPPWRAWPSHLQPERVFCFKYERQVQADNTVRFAGSQLQLLPSAQRLSSARARVACTSSSMAAAPSSTVVSWSLPEQLLQMRRRCARAMAVVCAWTCLRNPRTHHQPIRIRHSHSSACTVETWPEPSLETLHGRPSVDKIP